MSKPDPLDPKNIKTTRFEISEDELTARMQKQFSMHDKPLMRAAKVLESAIGKVVSRLGVDVTKGDESIRTQMELLGIHCNTLENYPGIFIALDKGDGFTPYAWISDAVLTSDGKYHYEIQWFVDNRMDAVEGEKIIN